MQITGASMQALYFQTKYKESREGIAPSAVKPVDALSEKRAAAEEVSRNTETRTTGFADILSMQCKKDMIKNQEEELESIRINNPEKYQTIMGDREASNIKTFDQLVNFVASGKNINSYQDVSVDMISKRMEIGNTKNSHSITARLSNGWSLTFTRDAIDAIAGMLDMFSSEDVHEIMKAITADRMAAEEEEENEKAEADVGKAEEDPESQPIKAAKKWEETEETKETKEESEVNTQIVENADGSKQLVITTKIGDTEMITKIKLSPDKKEDKFKRDQDNFTNKPRDEQQLQQYEKGLNSKISEFAIQKAASAYESNFMYA